MTLCFGPYEQGHMQLKVSFAGIGERVSVAFNCSRYANHKSINWKSGELDSIVGSSFGNPIYVVAWLNSFVTQIVVST